MPEFLPRHSCICCPWLRSCDSWLSDLQNPNHRFAPISGAVVHVASKPLLASLPISHADIAFESTALQYDSSEHDNSRFRTAAAILIVEDAGDAIAQAAALTPHVCAAAAA